MGGCQRRLDLIVYVPPVVLPGGDGFRLGGRHAEVDACIRRELILLRQRGGKVLGMEGIAPGERLAAVLEFVRLRKFSAGG